MYPGILYLSGVSYAFVFTLIMAMPSWRYVILAVAIIVGLVGLSYLDSDYFEPIVKYTHIWRSGNYGLWSLLICLPIKTGMLRAKSLKVPAIWRFLTLLPVSIVGYLAVLLLSGSLD